MPNEPEYIGVVITSMNFVEIFGGENDGSPAVGITYRTSDGTETAIAFNAAELAWVIRSLRVIGEYIREREQELQ